MTQEVLIMTESGIRRLEGDELEAFLKSREESEANALQQLIFETRAKRNNLLLNCDWIELPSASQRLTADKITEWSAYRQALRDVPQQSGFPSEVQWPTQPE